MTKKKQRIQLHVTSSPTSLNLPSSLQSVQQFEYLASFNAKTTKTNFGFWHSAEKRWFFCQTQIAGWLQAAAFVEQFKTKSKIYNQICSSSER